LDEQEAMAGNFKLGAFDPICQCQFTGLLLPFTYHQLHFIDLQSPFIH